MENLLSRCVSWIKSAHLTHFCLFRYEEEIIRLRRELESRSPQTTAVSSTTANTLTAPIAPTAAPNNSLSNGNSNAFSYQPPPLLSHNPLQQSASAPLPYGGSNDIPSTPLSLLGNEHAKKMDPMRSHHMQHPQYQPMPMNGNSRKGCRGDVDVF